MSKGSNPQPATNDNFSLEDESLNNGQETTPVPLGAGECKVAGRFLTPIYNERRQKAPATRTGKK